MQTEIIAKATGTTTTTSANVIELNAPSVVRLDLDRSQVAAMEREGAFSDDPDAMPCAPAAFCLVAPL